MPPASKNKSKRPLHEAVLGNSRGKKLKAKGVVTEKHAETSVDSRVSVVRMMMVCARLALSNNFDDGDIPKELGVVGEVLGGTTGRLSNGGDEMEEQVVAPLPKVSSTVFDRKVGYIRGIVLPLGW
jgi:hypothetical protein